MSTTNLGDLVIERLLVKLGNVPVVRVTVTEDTDEFNKKRTNYEFPVEVFKVVIRNYPDTDQYRPLVEVYGRGGQHIFGRQIDRDGIVKIIDYVNTVRKKLLREDIERLSDLTRNSN